MLTRVERVVDVRERADGLALRVHRRIEEVVRAVAEQRLRDRRADEGSQDEQDDRDAAADRDLVALEAAPDLLPVPTRLDLDLAELDPGLERDRAGHACACAEDFLFGSLCHESAEIPFARDQ